MTYREFRKHKAVGYIGLEIQSSAYTRKPIRKQYYLNCKLIEHYCSTDELRAVDRFINKIIDKIINNK